jgi:GT2 family glycosyltransferase
VNTLGVVVIGRNEGERLRRCLLSVPAQSMPVVYVDSGSSDGSVELARGMGIEVLELEASVPFTAARAINAGWQHLLHRVPEIQWVQIVAGDCELVEGWLERGRTELQRRKDVAVVCGHQRERSPHTSVYNRLAAIEWDGPTGEDVQCPGCCMMRVSALRQVGGYNPTLIAGEEPELFLRLRRQGWNTLRVDSEMARHDMDMRHFSQWWRRSIRTGFAYAAGAWMHGRAAERFWVRESLSIWLWGLVLPLLACGGLRLTRGLSLLLILGYPALALRIVRRMRLQGYSTGDSLVYALSCVVGKFPQLWGQLRFLRAQWRGQPGHLVEYK